MAGLKLNLQSGQICQWYIITFPVKNNKRNGTKQNSFELIGLEIKCRVLSSCLRGSSTCAFQDMGSSRPSRHCKNEHLRLQKGQSKTNRKLPFHSREACCSFSSSASILTTLSSRRVHQFVDCDVEGLFWLWVGTKSEQLICFGKALDTRAIGSVSLCHFSQGPLTHLKRK